jgi:hypothetical protein
LSQNAGCFEELKKNATLAANFLIKSYVKIYSSGYKSNIFMYLCQYFKNCMKNEEKFILSVSGIMLPPKLCR